MGTLGSGDVLVLTLPPGRYTLGLRFLYISSPPQDLVLGAGDVRRIRAERAWGRGPFDVRYFTRRKEAIRVEVS